MWGLAVMLLVLGLAAWAGVPVVYDGGDPAAVAAFVAERTGLPASELSPVALDTLLVAPPRALGEASLRRCAREPSAPSEIQSEIGRAQSAWGSSDAASAMDHLDLALALAGCLPTIVEPAMLGQAFLLRAAVAQDAGDVDTAKSELRTALALTPDAAWPPAWGPEGAALLAEVAAQPATFALAVLPPPAASGPWIDGRAASATQPLSVGLHLAQYPGSTGIQSAWLTVGAEARLVVPSSYRRPILEAMGDASARGAVEALLEATLPELDAAYVAHGGGLWLVTRDGGALATTELAPLTPAPVAAETGKKKRK